jgi:hypothetical protein
MHEPRPHQRVIPFTGMQGWLLWTPAEGFQPTGQVMCMVAHAEGHENHRTDAQERPPIAVKARLEGPLLEDGQHALPLLHAQAGGPGMGCVCKLPMAPWCCRSCRAHWLPAIRLTPSRRAMSAWESCPAWSSRPASRRRSSR